MISFKQFILLESKKEFVDSFIKTIEKIKEKFNSTKSEDPDKIDGVKKKSIEEIEESIEKLFSDFSKNMVYIEEEKIVEEIKEFFKELKLKNKLFDLYLEAGLEQNKRAKFEDEISDLNSKEETDKDVEEKAKKNAKDDDEFEKEVEKEIESEKKQPKKAKKILLGIIEKEFDGEVSEAYIGETDLKEKQIEGLEYREDVSNAINNMRLLKTPAAIAKRIKELGGTIVYFYDEKKRNNDEEFWKVVKI